MVRPGDFLVYSNDLPRSTFVHSLADENSLREVSSLVLQRGMLVVVLSISPSTWTGGFEAMLLVNGTTCWVSGDRDFWSNRRIFKHIAHS